MRVENFYYQSSNCKDNIYATIFKPENDTEIIGIIQVVHGMCEYMDKYREFASYMTLKGFVVCGEDHLGHGKTAGLKNLGKLNNTDTAFNFVRDIRRLRNIMRQRYGTQIPYHFLGHSMGSFIVRLYAARYNTRDLSSVILCGTSGTHPLTNKAMKLLELDMKINGSASSSVILEKLLLKKEKTHMNFNQVVYAFLNSNDAEKERKKNNPYCNFLFSNRAFYILLAMVSRISKSGWYKNIDKDLKILLISGEHDAVGAFGNGVREVYSKLCEAGVKNVNYILYKNARHEILTENIRILVFNDIYKFLTEDYE